MTAPRAGRALATLSRQQSVAFLVSVLLQLGLGWLALSQQNLETALRVVGIAAVAAAVWTSGRLWRQQRRTDAGSLQPAALAAEQAASVESVVTVFDRLVLPGKERRPSPVVTLVERLPNLHQVRLLASPDTASAVPAVDRVAELREWLTAHYPSRALDIALMDVRLADASFDEDDQRGLVHALEAAKRLPGLIVDITAGTKVMSLVLLRAAEEAALPVTYLLQPTSDRVVTAFQGLTSLSDPDGLFNSSGASHAQ